MYSMAAFGPVLGFLLGAYLLSFHMDSLSSNVVSIGECFRAEPFVFLEPSYIHIQICNNSFWCLVNRSFGPKMGRNVVGWLYDMRRASYARCHSLLLLSQGKQKEPFFLTLSLLVLTCKFIHENYPRLHSKQILTREKKKIRSEQHRLQQTVISSQNSSSSLPRQTQKPQSSATLHSTSNNKDSGYGKDIKGNWRWQ